MRPQSAQEPMKETNHVIGLGAEQTPIVVITDFESPIVVLRAQSVRRIQFSLHAKKPVTVNMQMNAHST